MNLTVIHGISAILFFLSEGEVYTPFPGNSKPQKENSLSTRLRNAKGILISRKENSLFVVWNSLEMGYKPHLPTKKK